MRPKRRANKRSYNRIESSDDDNEIPAKKPSPESNNNPKQVNLSEDSSSDSDIESYLKPASEINLSSSFFRPTMQVLQSDECKAVQEQHVGNLSDSNESDVETITKSLEVKEDKILEEAPAPDYFEHINNYNKHLEEAKKYIENYKAKKLKEENTLNIAEVLKNEEEISCESLEDYKHFSDSDEEDWEEVKDEKELIPKEGVEITINLGGNVNKKKSVSVMDVIKRKINRVKKENHVFIHKVHLLCWIAHGIFVNNVLSNQNTLALALSLLPPQHCAPSSRVDLSYLEKIVKWYSKMMTNKSNLNDPVGEFESLLEQQITRKEAFNYKFYVYIFICILRSLGIKCRLILSLQIVPLRPPVTELCSLKQTQNKKLVNLNSSTSEKEKNGSLCAKLKEEKKTDKTEKKSKQQVTKNGAVDSKKKKKEATNSEYFASKTPPSKNKGKSKSSPSPSSSKLSEKLSPKEHKPSTSRGHNKKVTMKTRSNTSQSRFFQVTPNKKQLDVRNDIIGLVTSSLQSSPHARLLRSKVGKRKAEEDVGSCTSPKVAAAAAAGDDFKNKKEIKVKRRIPTKKQLEEIEKQKSIEKEELKRAKSVNVWIEVFAEAEEKWISVDVIKGQVHCVKEIYNRATHPISYVLSFDNEKRIKDVTKRYCDNWNTVTRKLRVDEKWWSETLKPYRGSQTAIDREEDEDLARKQQEQPLPKAISEYKNHPLYVLKRHLLKFEAIYPPDALTLGFVRNEAVYPRDCVYTLHSREIWLKHAKVVRPGETPYKIVKSRPKWDKLSNKLITDQPLEIFGSWQVEDYVPPTAENGLVPRNAYGNVELFKSCMLPKGTVHLQLPGLNKTARKLNIDCAPAVIGFDFHSGWSHPTFNGFIVCEEFAEQLVAAWFEEKQEAEKKEQEKIEKRVYGNWRRLIRGLLIKQRLKAKYDFGEPSTSKN